jgi:hypothetical protein
MIVSSAKIMGAEVLFIILSKSYIQEAEVLKQSLVGLHVTFSVNL